MTYWVRGLAAAVTLGLAGCFSYVPIESAPQPGTRIRARLSAAEAIRVSERTGELRRELAGTIVAVDEDAISVHVVFARIQSGRGQSFANQDTLTIQLSEVLELQEQRSSWIKTGVLGTIVGGIVVFGALEALDGVSGKGQVDSSGGGVR